MMLLQKKLSGAKSERRVYLFECVTSTLDKSFELIARGGFDIWDSVLAVTQTEGRGQMRRFWSSPAGNLHASLRLPFAPPFTTQGAAVAASALCMLALRRMGFDIRIKWPNDLVLEQSGIAHKAGGIIIEEHYYSLVAGIGLNLNIAPDIGREMWDLPITRFADYAEGLEELEIAAFWETIVKNMMEDYIASSFSSNWKNIAQDGMIWLGRNVMLLDGDVSVSGTLAGLTDEGRIQIETSAGIMTFGSGNLILDE